MARDALVTARESWFTHFENLVAQSQGSWICGWAKFAPIYLFRPGADRHKMDKMSSRLHILLWLSVSSWLVVASPSSFDHSSHTYSPTQTHALIEIQIIHHLSVPIIAALTAVWTLCLHQIHVMRAHSSWNESVATVRLYDQKYGSRPELVLFSIANYHSRQLRTRLARL